jgi:hypothetical protein
MADTVTIDQAITGGGIRSVHFFNGRLLTGEDMTREQDAQRIARLRLGRAIGSGVVSGLEVSRSLDASKERPAVRVHAGLAVNREGRVLELTGTTELSLVRAQADGSAAEVLFEDCTPFQPASYFAGAGVYLLTIAPTETREGRAKVSGLGNEEADCNTAFSVEGVQLRLLKLALPPALSSPTSRLRNRLAHLMLGTADPRRLVFERNPLGEPVGTYGFLDDLRETGCLGDKQVPLAVLTWTAADGIGFIDLWSVRRRLADAGADVRMPTLLSDRRQAEAEATFLQFQGQIGDLDAAAALGSVTAADRFDYLPPVGIVPISGSGSLVGFDPDGFLGDQGSRELATTDAALVRSLVQQSFWHDPIEVGGAERIQRYVVWENELAVEAGDVGRRALVFARRTLPYCGIARYGRARFGLSRFAPSVI